MIRFGRFLRRRKGNEECFPFCCMILYYFSFLLAFAHGLGCIETWRWFMIPFGACGRCGVLGGNSIVNLIV